MYFPMNSDEGNEWIAQKACSQIKNLFIYFLAALSDTCSEMAYPCVFKRALKEGGRKG